VTTSRMPTASSITNTRFFIDSPHHATTYPSTGVVIVFLFVLVTHEDKKSALEWKRGGYFEARDSQGNNCGTSFSEERRKGYFVD